MKLPLLKVIKEKKEKKTPKEKSDYQVYLSSKEWKETRKWFFENIYEKKCYFCGRYEGENGAKINLHHNTYKYLGDEINHPHCCIPACSTCHIALHRAKHNLCRFKKNTSK